MAKLKIGNNEFYVPDAHNWLVLAIGDGGRIVFANPLGGTADQHPVISDATLKQEGVKTVAIVPAQYIQSVGG